MFHNNQSARHVTIKTFIVANDCTLLRKAHSPPLPVQACELPTKNTANDSL
ncbi:MAG: hypothetical protein KAG53_01215 [Endozoicomonadaceae bacterium]|nr:hypothetical protein [Endozoicomonadaceae bacterium]